MAGKVIDATLRFVDKFTAPMGKALGKIEKSSRQMQRLGKDVEKTGKNITNAGKTLTKGITVPVVAAGAASIKAGIDFESAFTGVAKTVDATDEQLATLRQGIIDMSKEIPASTTEISGVAEAAGQLGIETDNILDFSKVMIDLGNSTNLSAETAASSLAKYANVTGMSQKDFDKLGSTIVDLGNHFATTEADIVGMATRLAGAGSQIGLTDGEIMGFATALSSVGIEAEMGGSAFSKAMINMQLACETGLGDVQELSKKTGMSLRELQLMSENNSGDFKDMAQSLGYTNSEMKAMIKAGVNLENFADVAGMTSEQFKKSYEKDAAGAMQSFIAGLGDTESKGESTIKMLQDMGFTEVRLRDTLTRLSQDGEGVSKAIQMGNSAWEENNALTKEASQRYATTQSKIDVAKNKLNALGIQTSGILMPSFNKLIDKASNLATKFSNLSPKTQGTIIKIAGLAAAIGPCLLMVGKIVPSVGKFIKVLTKLPKILGVAKAAIGFLTSPIGLVVVGIAAVIAIGVLLYKNWDKIKAKASDLWGHVKKIFGGLGKWFGGIWDGIKTGFKGFVNFIIGGLNKIPEGLNKLSVKIPKWVPGVGGKKLGFSVPTIPYLAKGTNNWKGGLAVTQDKGGEIMDLPRGTRVYPHDKSIQKAYQDGGKSSTKRPVQITIQKLADKIEVRNEADIDMMVNKLADRFEKIINNGGGEVEFAS